MRIGVIFLLFLMGCLAQEIQESSHNKKLKILIVDEKMNIIKSMPLNEGVKEISLEEYDKLIQIDITSPKKELQASLKNSSSDLFKEELKTALENEEDKIQSIAKSTLYEERFERNRFMGDFLGFEPHKFNYILPANISTNTEPNEAKRVEAKFQISIKKLLYDDLFFKDLDFYFAYTQQSYWQLYDNENSRPFRESNYEPSLYLSYPLDKKFFFDRVDFGYVHQSNGGDLTKSRSWDRLFVEGIYSKGNFVMGLKAWYRIKEDINKDDNPDIHKYLGYGDLTLAYLYNKHLFSATLRNNLRADNRGSILLDYSYPIYKNLYLYLQFFNGYGESLSDYNNSINRVGIGILFNR
ncbi:porin [Helicobacter valdiviensis]|uniref:Phosphatidylcholine 1-acylhydrolase n=1 Tax=Helicobacter valdiviensis TaxID=1458358 RepID=A0A2W6MX42_9HELI|nr:phospholipase A [Helicobacter valdiviensis]PZT48902.1 porin [Helicobacter valdiviensis]